jgi:dTDP-4-dehydrorhamnose 3,5-epimerase
MKIIPTELAGVMLVTITPHSDNRGLFGRTYDAATFAAAGLPTDWPQSNVSWNAKRGTLRGMHFQTAPKEEPKLVRCTAGRIYDVVIDLRPQSASFRKWIGAELSAANRDALYIPIGCAHGFITLEDNSEVYYMMGEVFDPTAASGVRWNDPGFAVAWPMVPAILSDRDATYPDFVA